MKDLTLIVLNLIGIYLLIGAGFSVLFLWKGKDKVDKSCKGMSIWSMLLLFPGLCAFWILFLRKWIKATRS